MGGEKGRETSLWIIKGYVVIILLTSVFIATIVTTSLYIRNKDSLNLKIGAEKISKEEYLQWMGYQKYDMTVLFKEKFNEDSGEKDYWSTEYDGEYPMRN